MSGLDLNRLKKNKEAILKAEIISILALWEKLLPKKGINKTNKNINNIDWQNLLSGKKLLFKDINDEEIKSFDIWDNFLNNWRDWRKHNSSDYLLQILFGISESLNSGIDKGSPKEDIKILPENERWLANAFGSFKRKIIYLEKYESEINNIIDGIKDKVLSVLDKETIPLEDLEEVRSKIKNLFSELLSDDRFPINDVSLWEQTYMPTSMFKALLSNYVLIHSDFNEIPDRQKVKWRILGIQYDKIGVAEKSLKLASISWYREITEKIDEEIKNLLEIKYPIGNEIYRDETGIYFIVGEDLGEDLNDGSNLAKLKDDLGQVEDDILEKFKSLTEDEFYPAIFLTKASRGLMNLSTLLESAKENFLKVNWKKKSISLNIETSENGKAIGICPICQVRLIYEKDKEKQKNPTICEVCDNRIHHQRVDIWLNQDKAKGETIWIDEIKDKNNMVAYVSLKFELKDWLNGNLLNSLLVRDENFMDFFKNIKDLINDIRSINWNVNINFFSTNESNLKKFFELFDKNGIQKPYENLIKDRNIRKILTQPEINLDNRKKSLKDLFYRSINYTLKIFNKSLNEFINLIDNIQSSNYDFNEKRFKNQNILNNNQIKELIKSLFSLGFLLMQVYNTLLERSIGQAWEEFIYKQLNDNKPIKHKIDFDKREIYWNNLNNNDIEFLATLLLQFLLRKNPSPARLRRIWETTREFFEGIHKELEQILEIPEWRKKRLVWEIDLNYNNKLEKSMEFEAEGLLFWVEKEDNKAKIYLISSIRDFLEKFGNNKVKKALENSNELNIEEEILKNVDTFKNKDYINDKEIILYPYGNKKDDKNKIELDIKDDLIEIHSYKPYTSITDPSPINYQVIIPAEYLPRLIDEVIDRYNKEFKYVYGKFPIHIGIVVSDCKKPVYVSLKALRRIRRDVENIDRLSRELSVETFCVLQKQKLSLSNTYEKINNTEDYYSLYWDNLERKDYNFFIKPENKWKKWISTIDKFEPYSKIQIIPNTFDFEYLDHNIRRNEIFYDQNGKRMIPAKQNRPYELEIHWEKFKKFKRLFDETNLNTSRLHKLVEILYSKLQVEKEYNPDYSYLLTSSFIELLELNRKGKDYAQRRKLISDIFELGLSDFEKLSDEFKENLKKELTKKENIYLFLDMFEFWHTTLKEI